jgi:hypothetical protein
MIVLAGRPRPSAFGSGVFLTGLLRRLDPHFFGVLFGYFGAPDWHILRHSNSLSLVDRYFVRRALDIDVDVFLGMDASSEKEVESEDCQQDNDNDGYRSHTTGTIIFSHISSLLGLTAVKRFSLK